MWFSQRNRESFNAELSQISRKSCGFRIMDEDTGPIDKSREFLQIQSGAVHQFTEEYGSGSGEISPWMAMPTPGYCLYHKGERASKTVNPVAQRTVIELIILKRQF